LWLFSSPELSWRNVSYFFVKKRTDTNNPLARTLRITADLRRIGLDEVVGLFTESEDPRSTVNLRHPLVSVVDVALMAVWPTPAGRPHPSGKSVAIKRCGWSEDFRREVPTGANLYCALALSGFGLASPGQRILKCLFC